MTRRFNILHLAFGSLLAVVIVAVIVVMDDSSQDGPGLDAELAARSLEHALVSRDGATVRVRCEGIRDGKDFFACAVRRATTSPSSSYQLDWSESTHFYTASGTRTGGRVDRLRFAPLK